MTTPLNRKLDRLEAGLAPEDETLEQAEQTARLRDDPDYVDKWLAHERKGQG